MRGIMDGAAGSLPDRGGLLTLAEVAERLRITEKAARRRLERGGFDELRIVRIGRSVRVSDEDLEAWIGRKGEIGGAREKAARSMHVSAPPYANDPTRRHVSILFDPSLGIPRKRLVTPFACDEARGVAWGHEQGLKILGQIVTQGSETPANNAPRAKERDSNTPKPSTTLAELWDLYSAEKGARLRPQTRRVNETRWRNRIAPVLGEVPIAQIGKPEITRLRSKLAHNDAHFANQVLGLLRRMLEFAAEQGLLEDAPAIRSERGSRKPATPAPDEEDLEILLRSAERLTAAGRYQGTDLVLMILLGLDAGLRPGEVAGLRWCDVELKHSRIIVRNSRASAGNSDLPPKAGEAGAVYLTERLKARLAAEQRRVGGRGTAYVCRDAEGGPLFTVTVSKRVADIHEDAGLEVRRGHRMRHWAASRLINQGATLEQTSAHLRHSDLQVTQRYVHRVIGHDPGPAAADVLNQRIAPAPAPVIPLHPTPAANAAAKRAPSPRGKRVANGGK